MRRPRHKLQISTFPFLAVLLGAMGSLIFLLLVMDRRAKLVARNKVREAQEMRLASAAAADQQRRDDWERQRRQLHEALAAQDQALRGQLSQTLGTLQRTGEQLQTSAAVQQQLQNRINAERQRLRLQRDELRQRKTALAQSAELADASKAELSRLTRELLDLEQTLDGLRRLRERQQPTYSLVPYRGQRGANRMPIYVECTAAGLVFLPDGQRLASAELDIGLIRKEVERRHGPLVKAARANPFQPNPADEEPYVLFLVRPDGIGSYYQGQNALRGYQIDFGYELVDADWTLDVPSQGDWKAIVQAPARDRPAIGRSPGATQVPGFVGGPPGPANGPPGDGIPGVAGHDNEPGSARGGSGRGSPPGISNGVGGGGANGPGNPAIGGMPRPATGVTIGFSANPGTGVGTNKTGFTQPSGESLTAATDSDTPGAAIAPTFRPAQTKGAPGALLEGPAPGLKVPGASVGGSGPASGTSSAKPPANAPGAAPTASNGTSPPEPGNATNRLALPAPVVQKQTKVSPVSLGRVIGNRDFIVTIACYGEGVVVTPGSASFVWNGKADGPATDETLVRTVLQLVQRRQATVRPGEPPYRAVLRFEVHEQGRRTYHHVFPLLENLRLPMVREDVEE